jgi:hypothetical protein
LLFLAMPTAMVNGQEWAEMSSRCSGSLQYCPPMYGPQGSAPGNRDFPYEDLGLSQNRGGQTHRARGENFLIYTRSHSITRINGILCVLFIAKYRYAPDMAMTLVERGCNLPARLEFQPCLQRGSIVAFSHLYSSNTADWTGSEQFLPRRQTNE